MEMNTRLQVEHPVTEMITGQDLVEWQLRVAASEPLPKLQPALVMRGHAIEARIYAEDPDRGFLPSIGRIAHWRMPEASERVRVDTGFRAGDEVSAYYDPMLAKVIAWGEDRVRARDELLRALGACEVTGVATNVAFLERVVAQEAFAAARIDTGFIDANRGALLDPADEAPVVALVAAAVAEYRTLEATARAAGATSADPWSPWQLTDAWWNGTVTHRVVFTFADGAREHPITIRPGADGWLDVRGDAFATSVRAESSGEQLHLEIRDADAAQARSGAHSASVVREATLRHVFVPGMRARLTYVDPLAHAGDDTEHAGHLAAPMSGTIVAVMVAAGDEVAKGAPLVVLEAMKMEHAIVAPAAGRVAAVHFAVGDRVAEGADVVDLEEAAAGTTEPAARTKSRQRVPR